MPQGPGVLNISLVWRSDGTTPSGTDAIYLDLCNGLVAALARLDIVATPETVQGSFCDGRFNLAVGGRKLVGTAQSWRRVGRVPVALAHAVILATCDAALLMERANAFEAAAGSGRRYRANAVTTVAQSWCDAHGQAAPAFGTAGAAFVVLVVVFLAVFFGAAFASADRATVATPIAATPTVAMKPIRTR